jgi:hypothetical protein
MANRKNTSPIIEDISHLTAQWDAPALLERRNAYDANDNVEYQGWARPGVGAGELGWLIVKHTWAAGTVSGFNNTQTRLASDEVKFDKEWDERASYF